MAVRTAAHVAGVVDEARVRVAVAAHARRVAAAAHAALVDRELAEQRAYI